jgi:hypothetical protein
MKDGDDIGKHKEMNEGNTTTTYNEREGKNDGKHLPCTRQKKDESAEVILYSV